MVIVGSREDIKRFSSLLRKYVADPGNVPQSEHEHHGPYMDLEVMTWTEADLVGHSIHGSLADLHRLAGAVENRIAEPEAGLAHGSGTSSRTRRSTLSCWSSARIVSIRALWTVISKPKSTLTSRFARRSLRLCGTLARAEPGAAWFVVQRARHVCGTLARAEPGAAWFVVPRLRASTQQEGPGRAQRSEHGRSPFDVQCRGSIPRRGDVRRCSSCPIVWRGRRRGACRAIA